MATLADLVFDCRHAASLARFWQAVLDEYQIAAYDDAEIARLADLGIHDLEDDPTVLLEPTGAGPRIWFQTVPEPKTAKNRLHLDLRAGEIADEVTRLVALGARLAEGQSSTGQTVMIDPEGNEFCLMPVS